MKRIIDFRRGAVNRAFRVECGDLTGKRMIINQVPAPNPYLEWNKIHYGYLSDDKKYLFGDQFTIQIIVSWLVEQAFRERGLPHFVLLRTGFICTGNGHTLNDAPRKWEQAITANIAKSVIVQLIIMMRELEKMEFAYGCSNLILCKENISYNYDGVHVESDVTLKVHNFQNASITYNGIHIYSLNEHQRTCLDKSIFVPKIVTALLGERKYYKLTNSTMDVYSAMHQIGLSLFGSSFDYYCMMIELMCMPEFYSAVTSDAALNNMWSEMWLKEDLDIINGLIKDKSSCDNIQSIVKGLWLRADIIDSAWNKLKIG
jgi:hypothetical protein